MYSYFARIMSLLFFTSCFSQGYTLSSEHVDAQQYVPVEVHVGIYAPFSEKNAFIGRNMLAAMEMARDKLHSNTVHYSFFTLDEVADSADAPRVLQKFIDAHHINVLMTQDSSHGLIAASLAKQNNLIHFNLSRNSKIADGRHSFLARRSDSESLTTLQPNFVAEYKEAYFNNHPAVEAGYAFDVFTVLHQSILVSLPKEQGRFSTSAIAYQLHKMPSGQGVMGAFNVEQNGVVYVQSEVKRVA